MENDIPEINELIKQFSKLPGLGPKSAKRIILKLINNKDSMVKPLAKSLATVYKNVVRCVDCGNLKIIDRYSWFQEEQNNELQKSNIIIEPDDGRETDDFGYALDFTENFLRQMILQRPQKLQFRF